MPVTEGVGESSFHCRHLFLTSHSMPSMFCCGASRGCPNTPKPWYSVTPPTSLKTVSTFSSVSVTCLQGTDKDTCRSTYQQTPEQSALHIISASQTAQCAHEHVGVVVAQPGSSTCENQANRRLRPLALVAWRLLLSACSLCSAAECARLWASGKAVGAW